MKIRIKGNSVRMRLNRSEVSKLTTEGYVEEHTAFGESKFTYALKSVKEGEELTASFEKNMITMFVPIILIQDWSNNDITGFSASMPLNEKESLALLLEKDFQCLDRIEEDHHDKYENPNKHC